SRASGKVRKHGAGLEQPSRRNPGRDFAGEVEASPRVATRPPGARRGIYALAFDGLRRDDSEDSEALRTRLSPIYDSGEQSRCAASRADREKDWKLGLLSGSVALAAAVQVARP